MDRPSSSTSTRTINILGDDGKLLGTVVPRDGSTVNEILKCVEATAVFNNLDSYEVDWTITLKPKQVIEVEEPKVEKKYEMKTTRVRLGDYGTVLDFKYNPKWKNDTMKKKVMNFLFERFTTNDEYKSHEMYFRLTSRSLYVHGDLMFQRLETIVGSEQLLDVIIVKN